jgi:hypothetical protein
MKVGAIPVTLLMAMSLTVSITQGLATERIYDDPGGQIGEYLAKFRAIRISGERVVIDGTCASACTLVLGTIPRHQICVTPRATTSSAGNKILWSSYPSDVRKWISRHGGLQSHMIYLHGSELFAMYPVCR